MVAFTFLVVSLGADGAVVLKGRSKQGIVPRDPPHLRIPHHAFQTWLSGDGPDEATLAKWMGETGQEPKKPNHAMGAINRFRAKICWEMKDAHGEEFSSFDQCNKFMEEACRPGGDLAMDGDRKEMPSQKGYCREYFPEDEDEAEKELEELEAEEAAKKEREAAEAQKAVAARKAMEEEEAKKAAAMKSAKEAELAKADAGKGKDAKAGAKEGAKGGAKEDADKNAAPASPSPAGAGAPAGPPLPADEAWYWKNNNKDPARYHMNEEMKLPTQGYYGELVEHDDMKTATRDWHNEFDEKQSVSAICHEHPHSAWCRKKGYGGMFGRFRNSGSSVLANSMVPTLLMLSAVMSLV